MRSTLFPLLLSVCFSVSTAAAAGAEGLPAEQQNFLNRYCIDCHGPDTQESDFRVDTMLKISATAADAEYWQLVLDNLHLGEMPPEGEAQPTKAELEVMTDWTLAELRRAKAVLGGERDEVVLRRLNRTEYENTIADLLGVRGDYAIGFPEDATADGFDNVGSALVLSAEQLQQYLNAANFILDRAIELDPKPQWQSVSTTLREMQENDWERSIRRDLSKEHGRRYEPSEDEIQQAIEERRANPPGGPFYPRHGQDDLIPVQYLKPNTRGMIRVERPGIYRYRVTAYPVNNDGEIVPVRVTYGTGKKSDVQSIADVIQLKDPEPAEHEYELYLQPGDLIELEMLTGTRWARGEDIRGLETPAVAIREITMEGPVIEQWPPAGHRAMFGNYDAANLSADQGADVIVQFAPKLFRRPVGKSVTDDFVQFYRDNLSEGIKPLDAVRQTFKAMMASPFFVYHLEPAKQIDGYAIANRLSYFLWRTLPDDGLLQAASSGALTDPQEIRRQVVRLLEDPKSHRFFEDFVGQWLEVKEVGEMQPDENLYPEYDLQLEDAMVQETVGFIEEMIRSDRPIRDLIESDWTILNDRLARHYKIDGVEGNHFRKVSLDPSETIRGGVLTHASVLNVTSNGTVTSPVVRGVWMLERFLGTPAPPPPPDVPAIEPDIRGASTIQEQLEKHRSIEQCGACHRKIDPYGIAMENFDVIGGWRDRYRALEPSRNPNRPNLVDGPTVIAEDRLPGGATFANFREFRSQLMAKEDLVALNVARQLATFGLGRRMNFADELELKEIVESVHRRDKGMRTLLIELTASELFRRP